MSGRSKYLTICRVYCVCLCIRAKGTCKSVNAACEYARLSAKSACRAIMFVCMNGCKRGSGTDPALGVLCCLLRTITLPCSQLCAPFYIVLLANFDTTSSSDSGTAQPLFHQSSPFLLVHTIWIPRLAFKVHTENSYKNIFFVKDFASRHGKIGN